MIAIYMTPVQRLHKVTLPNPKTNTAQMQCRGRGGEGSVAEGLPEQPRRNRAPVREKVPKHLKTCSLPLRLLKTQ